MASLWKTVLWQQFSASPGLLDNALLAVPICSGTGTSGTIPQHQNTQHQGRML